MFKLVIQDDEGKTTVVPLIREELTIGRKEGNTIRLTERNVSRSHARLTRQNGSLTIEDLGSYNGIRVNGSRIQGTCQISEADRVQIGDYLIEVKSEANDKVDTLNDRTVPIDHVALAKTPVPELTSPVDSGQVTNRMADGNGAAPAYSGQHPTEQMQTPVDDLAQTVPIVAGSAAKSGGPRIVVLSTNMAGREFDLDKPSMVIGRTEENEVWINHRSISRHHAKIVNEGGRYSVVDLQSSNGVRVNGEEYGKVELRRGDVIDLGHVRLRFVEAGEDFVFGRDAQAVDIGGGGRSKAVVWLAVGLLLTGAGVALFLMLSGGGKKDDKPKSAAGGTPKETPVVNPPAVQSDAAPADVEPDNVQAAEITEKIDAARQAVNNEKWEDAERAAREALVIDLDNEEAKLLLEQAQAEAAAKELYDEFAKAVQAKNYEKVAEIFKQFDPESVYQVKAQPDHDRLKADFIKFRSNKGKTLAGRGKCADQKQLAKESGDVWTDAESAVMRHTCKTRTASNGDNGGGGQPDNGGGQPDNGGTEDSGPTFEVLLAQARQAARDGQYGKALRSCELALAKRPSDQSAIQTCAVASCRLKSSRRAKGYLRRINSENRKQAVRQICLTAGVTDI